MDSKKLPNGLEQSLRLALAHSREHEPELLLVAIAFAPVQESASIRYCLLGSSGKRLECLLKEQDLDVSLLCCFQASAGLREDTGIAAAWAIECWISSHVPIDAAVKAIMDLVEKNARNYQSPAKGILDMDVIKIVLK